WQGEWPLPESIPNEGPAKTATKVFQVLPGARLQAHRSNDGDSFTLSHGGQTYTFRLYFADCPEKERHGYNEERLREQGAYFGGLREKETVAIGKLAKERTEEWLNRQPFTVYTKWQGVYDSGRYYAFVIFADGEDLSEKLVREGLARIHTTGTTLPDGRSRQAFEAHLRNLEGQARAARRGGWGRLN
ncbi:MAG TPA: thermonuclease family protein, partial [Prosthecobacter sp.]|nr:thermonuclease family protein [Prosthecobacter sp.]